MALLRLVRKIKLLFVFIIFYFETSFSSFLNFFSSFVAFNEKAELNPPQEAVKKHLIVALTSDRGLCGAIHSSIVKAVRGMLNEKKENLDTKIVCVGDKSRSMLQRQFGRSILFSVNDIGKKTPTFLDSATIANGILSSGYEFDSGEILFNRFKSVLSLSFSFYLFHINS